MLEVLDNVKGQPGKYGATAPARIAGARQNQLAAGRWALAARLMSVARWPDWLGAPCVAAAAARELVRWTG